MNIYLTAINISGMVFGRPLGKYVGSGTRKTGLNPSLSLPSHALAFLFQSHKGMTPVLLDTCEA